MSYTTIDDVKNRWMGYDPEQPFVNPLPASDAQIEIYIDDLEGQAEYAIADFVENVKENQPPLKIVKQTIANAVIEYLKTGGTQFQSESQSVGEYNRSVSVAGNARRKLLLNQDDIDVLSPKEDDLGRAFTISLGPPRPDYYGLFPGEYYLYGDKR